MKRRRHRRAPASFGVSARNFLQLLMMTRWITSTEAVQAPAAVAPVHRLDSEADRADQQQDHERGREPRLRILAQQFEIEERPGAGGGDQAVARVAHILRREPPAHRRAFGGNDDGIGLFAGDSCNATLGNRLQSRANSLKPSLRPG